MLLDMTRTAKFERWSSVAKKGGHRVYLHTHTHTGLSQPFRPRSLSFLASRPRAPNVHVGMPGQGEQACEVVIGQGQLPRSTCQRAAWCRHIIGNPNRRGLPSLRIKKPTNLWKLLLAAGLFFLVFHEGSRPSCVLLTSSSPLMIRCTWWLVTLGRKGVKSTFQMFLASMLLLVPKISHVIEIGICRLYILWSFFFVCFNLDCEK